MSAQATDSTVALAMESPVDSAETVTIDPSIASELSPEALTALKKSKSASRPKVTTPVPATATEASPTVADVTQVTNATVTADSSADDGDEFIIDLAADPTASSVEDSTDDEDDHTITDEQLSALPEDFRKKYRAKDKENLKLRNRSQEAEAKLKELEEAKIKLEQEVNTARATSGGGLQGNAFEQFTSAGTAEVAEWVETGSLINAKLQRINFLQAKGREVPDDLLKITLPNGKEVEIDEDLLDASTVWESDAKVWLQHQKTQAEDKTAASSLVSRLQKYDGYQASLDALRAKPPGRETLLAKAALYDYIVAKGGKITFQGKAASAQKDAVPGQTPVKAITSPTRGTVPSTPVGGSSKTSAERARLMKLAAQGDQDALEAALLLPKD